MFFQEEEIVDSKRNVWVTSCLPENEWIYEEGNETFAVEGITLGDVIYKYLHNEKWVGGH
uniref:Uncharacterized protein n=1 Tax=Marseillevirus LCMAC201 TaxID=2506605 RepID=A0A481YYJ1_9VIRU|nr:MAG: hypothetical protein LCMAC201_04370 [Marseillevirus LCMAC201]